MPYRIIKKVKKAVYPKLVRGEYAQNFGVDLEDDKTWQCFPLCRPKPRLIGEITQVLDASGNKLYAVNEKFEFEVHCSSSYIGLSSSEVYETRFLYLPVVFVRGYGINEEMFVDLLLYQSVVEIYGETSRTFLYPKRLVLGPTDVQPKSEKDKTVKDSEFALQSAISDVFDAKNSAQPTLTHPSSELNNNKTWDLFICHASEDKEQIAEPLAKGLADKGYTVWYDKFELKIGDSLRRSIERGLAGSRYGLVILSPNFFAKKWPPAELDGLTAREDAGRKVILPVWHKVDQQYVRRFSPMLADKYAASTSKGIDFVIGEIQKELGPAKNKPVDYVEGVQAYLFFPEGIPDEKRTLDYHAKNLRYRLIVNLNMKPPKAYYLTPDSDGWKFIEKYPHKWVSQILPSQELNDSLAAKWCAEKGFELKPWVAEKKHLLQT